MKYEIIEFSSNSPADEQFRVSARVGDLLNDIWPDGTPVTHMVVDKAWRRNVGQTSNQVKYTISLSTILVPRDLAQTGGSRWGEYRREVMVDFGWL